MIKDILVSLPVRPTSSNAAADYAISVATGFDAHVAGLALTYEPYVPGSVFNGVAADIVASYRAQTEKAGKAAVAKFDAAAQRAGVSAQSHLLETELAGIDELFAKAARRFDLSVVGQIEPGKDFAEEILPQTALFGSGRPVLVVPYIQKAGMKLDRILVCWDGSRAAARAIGDAMPFLARSKSIDIVTITRNEEPRDELPGVDIAQHLARHKLKVDFKRIVATDQDVAGIILSTAADLGSDMIVMGGYGHSRLREFVLGGATRGILAAMTVPVLMSH
jgi:nucleotide-binding universal stress UspA family protein